MMGCGTGSTITKEKGEAMYRIGICDDEKNTCADLEGMIMDFFKDSKTRYETLVWYTGEGVCDYLKQGNHIDILFLNIELVQMSGIEVGEYIRNEMNDRRMQIIYMSGNPAYACQLFKTHPLEFMLKPIRQDAVEDVLELALDIFEGDKNRFEFQRGKDHFSLPYGIITFFSCEGRKIRIHTPQSRIEYYGTMKELRNKLPEQFLVIHQSYIVNRTYVFRYTYESVEMMDGTVLEISRQNRRKVRREVLKKG